jgi:DNA-binding MurR/RpiR family transcriptional regulator
MGMSTKNTLVTRLHDAKGMSSSQRRIAACLQSNLDEAAFWGVEELAERAQSSVATVVRFAQRLGYSGFMEMRQSLVAQAKAKSAPEERLLLAPKEAAAMLVEVARQDMGNIERTVSGINEALLTRLVQSLEKARHRVLVGHGVSHIMSEHLCYLLTISGYVAVAGNPAEYARQVANLSPKDLLIAFSFRPYSQETLDVVAYAQKRHVPVIAFTDGLDSPLARHAELTICLAGENLMFTHSIAAYAVVSHAIAAALASKDREAAIKRLRETERILKPQLSEE